MARQERVNEVYISGGLDSEAWRNRLAAIEAELAALATEEPSRLLAAGKRMGEFAEA